MKTLAIDIETYSSVSLQKAGVYAYAASSDFEILLFGYHRRDQHRNARRGCVLRVQAPDHAGQSRAAPCKA